jgi:hypothetical protein
MESTDQPNEINQELNEKILPGDGMVLGMRVGNTWAWAKCEISPYDMQLSHAAFVTSFMEPMGAACRDYIRDAASAGS